MRPLIEIMKDVGVASRGLGQIERTDLLTNLFGTKNAQKLAGLLNDIGTDGWDKIKADALTRGPAVTDEDIENTKALNKASAGLKNAWAALKLEIFRRFAPTFTRSIEQWSRLLLKHKDVIANGVSKAWNTAVYFVSDFMRIVLGIDTILGEKVGYLPERFAWLHTLRSAIDGTIDVLKALFVVVL